MKYYFLNNNESKKIYYFLKDLKISENIVSKLRKKLGYIKINNIAKRTSDIIYHNETMVIDYEDDIITPNYPANNIPFEIIYEDDYYLIIDKPSNIATIPTNAHLKDNLASAVLYYQNTNNKHFVFRAINRLDLGTSGFVIIAKDMIAYNLLREYGNIKKEYIALSIGKCNQNGEINGAIEDDTINKKKIVSATGTKTATTYYTLLKFDKTHNISLIKLNLKNGRTNQIRAHMENIGHSLVSDKKYGNDSTLLDNFFLRCFHISFFHPILKQNMNFILDYKLPIEMK